MPKIELNFQSNVVLRTLLLILVLMIPNLAFGQVEGGEIPNKIRGLTEYIYNTLRWPICFLGLMIAVGMAKFLDNGVRQAVDVLFATIAWALVPNMIQVLQTIFR